MRVAVLSRRQQHPQWRLAAFCILADGIVDALLDLLAVPRRLVQAVYADQDLVRIEQLHHEAHHVLLKLGLAHAVGEE